MAVLGRNRIRECLDREEVFKPGTWDEEGLKEASYALRLAWDGLVVEGRPYPPGTCYEGSQICIEPGRLAILSTKEVLQMPGSVSGKVGVRLEFAALGLLGLMGIQVDPYYGQGLEDERLYFRVANVSNETIRLHPWDRVFNIELHDAEGAVAPDPSKERGWTRMQKLIRSQPDTSWTYITRVEHDVKDIEDRFHPLVFFGVILVAVTILGVMAGVTINADSTSAPNWIADWGWIMLVGTFAVGGGATAALLIAEAYRRMSMAFSEKARVARPPRGSWSRVPPLGRVAKTVIRAIGAPFRLWRSQ